MSTWRCRQPVPLRGCAILRIPVSLPPLYQKSRASDARVDHACPFSWPQLPDPWRRVCTRIRQPRFAKDRVLNMLAVIGVDEVDVAVRGLQQDRIGEFTENGCGRDAPAL